MNLKDLTPKQGEVVSTICGGAGTTLVLGEAGRGKTTAALWAAREFMEGHARSGSRVLFLTFSRSAVSQIASRGRNVLAGLHDRVEIQTFHSLAYRVIRGFGRYGGFGAVEPQIQSEARKKLLGQDNDMFTYDDLLPAALAIISSSEAIRTILRDRWPLIICDEVQDTSDNQWALVQMIKNDRLLLLGDPKQMIYTFIQGVGPERLAEIRAASDHEIRLEPQSHRDPSGLIPAMAEAVRQRLFTHSAVERAKTEGRLIVEQYQTGDATKQLIRAIQARRDEGARTVSVFGHSNVSVAEIAENLTAAEIDHVLVGIPEAHAEALRALDVLCRRSSAEVSADACREALAVFLTSNWRGKYPPLLAEQLIGRDELPVPLEAALVQLDDDLQECAGRPFGELVRLAGNAWVQLSIARGRKAWIRAAEHFGRLTRKLWAEPVDAGLLGQVRAVIEENRLAALVHLDHSEPGLVSLMNFHQTKGREADAVIHVYGADDYFGEETEPFERNSRLLYVSLTRARASVTVLLPPNPHPLVAPFAEI